MLKVKMTEEMYLAPGGCGSKSMDNKPYCALGKILHSFEELSGFERATFYVQFNKLVGNGSADSVYLINDAGKDSLKDNFATPENHYRALKLALQMLEEAGVEIELPEGCRESLKRGSRTCLKSTP